MWDKEVMTQMALAVLALVTLLSGLVVLTLVAGVLKGNGQ